MASVLTCLLLPLPPTSLNHLVHLISQRCYQNVAANNDALDIALPSVCCHAATRSDLRINCLIGHHVTFCHWSCCCQRDPIGLCTDAAVLVTQVATAAFKTLMAIMSDTCQWEALTGCVTRHPTGEQFCYQRIKQTRAMHELHCHALPDRVHFYTTSCTYRWKLLVSLQPGC